MVVWIDSTGKQLCYEILYAKEQVTANGVKLYYRLYYITLLQSYKKKLFQDVKDIFHMKDVSFCSTKVLGNTLIWDLIHMLN